MTKYLKSRRWFNQTRHKS